MRSVEKDAFHSLISEVSLDTDRQTDHVFLDMAKQNGGELSAHQFVAKSADQCDCRFSRAVVSLQLLGDGLCQIATGKLSLHFKILLSFSSGYI